MRWRGRRGSSNIEDRRGMRAGRQTLRVPRGFGRGGFGSRGGFSPRFGGRGVGGLGLIAIVLLVLFFGLDGLLVDNGRQFAPPASEGPAAPRPASEDELASFVSVVLADTETTWQGIFQSQGRRYVEPTLVLFDGAANSACGYAQSAMGPFYCPGDQRIYIDLSFYRDLKNQLGAPGDFAQAYVIAHEVAHHVQNLLGVSNQIQTRRQVVSQARSNALSVRLELQADCLAGLWAHHADRELQIIEPGDIDEAINAAGAIGDDRLQRQAGGAVVPDAFTHGSSAQRVRWFKRGLNSGDMQSCDTFSSDNL